jgi:hypothetical protein
MATIVDLGQVQGRSSPLLIADPVAQCIELLDQKHIAWCLLSCCLIIRSLWVGHSVFCIDVGGATHARACSAGPQM